MINTKIFCFTFIALLCSCARNEAPPQTPKSEPIPEALKDHSSILKSRSYEYENNILNELYEELTEKDPEFANIEKQLENLKETSTDSLKPFHSYEDKSASYYSEANQKANIIHDSMLERKILTLIKQSSGSFSSRTKFHRDLLEQINSNNHSLEDYHTVLKIISTMRIMEKYQRENLMDKKILLSIIKEQEATLKKLKDLSAKSGWKAE